MSKIIQDPQRLIDAFAKSFGEDYRETFENVFSQYISDAVIAVTAEGIAAQAIAWVNFREDFPCEPIDIDADIRRYVAVQNNLMQVLDTEAIIDYVEDDWDVNSSTTADAIQDAIFSIYTSLTVVEMVVNADARYSGGVNG